MYTWLSRIWLALTLSFLWMCPYLAQYNDAKNRYLFHWTRGDVAAIIAAMVLLALPGYLFCLLMVRLKRENASRTLALCFVVALCYLLAANLKTLLESLGADRFKNAAVTVFVLAVVTLGLWWRLDIRRLARLGITACLIFSPLIPIFLLTGLVHLSYARDRPATPLAASSDPSTNVYLFVFDGWSYRRCFADGQPLELMPNTRMLAERSVVFRDAHSPSDHTIHSLPNLIYQNQRPFSLQDGIPGFRDETFTRSDEMEQLFSRAGAAGFRTVMVGFYHKYEWMLGNKVDYCRSFCNYKDAGRGFMLTVGYHIARTIRNPLRKLPGDNDKLFNSYLINRFQASRLERTHELTSTVLSRSTGPTFALFHYPVPHDPYVFDAEGVKPLWAIYRRTLANYLDNVARMDSIVGEVMQKLDAAGKLDSSIIVLTADHAWTDDPELHRGDPTYSEMVTHIPLIMKFPYQKSRVDAHNPITTSRLERLIRAVLAGELEPDQVDEQSARLQLYVPPRMSDE